MEVERTLLAASKQCPVFGHSHLQSYDQPLPVRSGDPTVGSDPGNMNIQSNTFYMVHGDGTLGHFMDHQVLNIKLQDFSQVVRHCQSLNGIT